MQDKPALPLNDLDAFYKQYAKKDLLDKEDLDARVTLPPITRFFRIHRTEYAIRVIGQELPPNRYNFYFLSIVRQGTATKTDGLTTYRIRPNTLWSTPLGQIHSAKDWSADATGYYLQFSPDFIINEPNLQKLVQQLPFFQNDGQHHLYLSPADSDDVFGIFQKIEQEFNRPEDAARDNLIRLYIAEILWKAERLFASQKILFPEKENANTSLLRRFKNLIEKEFTRQKSVAFYADSLAVHPNYLNSVVKSETALTASELIQERVLQEAKYLLYQSELSVKEIAFYLNFEDTSYFSKFFKKHTGLSPLEYQQTYQPLKIS